MDLVILRLADEGMPLSLADSDTVKIGDPRLRDTLHRGAVIEEKGARGAVTEGTIHGVRQSDTHLRLRTLLSHGNSGGAPIINKAGDVIGVAVAGGSSIDDTGSIHTNIFAYAIPSNAVKHLLETAQDEEPFETWRERPRIHAYAEASHGYLKQRQGEYKAAIAHYTDALALNPDLIALYHNRGDSQKHERTSTRQLLLTGMQPLNAIPILWKHISIAGLRKLPWAILKDVLLIVVPPSNSIRMRCPPITIAPKPEWN